MKYSKNARFLKREIGIEPNESIECRRVINRKTTKSKAFFFDLSSLRYLYLMHSNYVNGWSTAMMTTRTTKGQKVHPNLKLHTWSMCALFEKQKSVKNLWASFVFSFVPLCANWNVLFMLCFVFFRLFILYLLPSLVGNFTWFFRSPSKFITNVWFEWPMFQHTCNEKKKKRRNVHT